MRIHKTIIFSRQYYIFWILVISVDNNSKNAAFECCVHKHEVCVTRPNHRPGRRGNDPWNLLQVYKSILQYYSIETFPTFNDNYKYWNKYHFANYGQETAWTTKPNIQKVNKRSHVKWNNPLWWNKKFKMPNYKAALFIITGETQVQE